MAEKLFVGNLPITVSETELRERFSVCGNIGEITLFHEKKFALVEMESSEEASALVRQFDGASIGGMSIMVQRVRPGAAYQNYGRSSTFKT